MKVLLALLLAPIGCLAIVILFAVGAALFAGASVVRAVAEHPIEILIDDDAPEDAVDQVLARASVGGRELRAVVRVDERHGSHDRTFVRIWVDDRDRVARGSIREAIDDLERSGALPRGAVSLESESRPASRPRRVAR